MPVDIKKLKIVENSSLAVTQTGKKIGLKDFAKKDRTRPYFAFSGHSGKSRQSEHRNPNQSEQLNPDQYEHVFLSKLSSRSRMN